MRIKLEPIGRLISGNNATEVVTKMRDIERKPVTGTLAPEEYMRIIVERAGKLANAIARDGLPTGCNYKDFNPKLEGSTEEQCKNFLDELEKNKLITVLER